jgi:hypothetical protein
MSRNVSSIVVALMLALGMAAAAQALPPRARPVERSLLAQVWSWIGSVLGQPRTNTWSTSTSDEGSQMDPNGAPR